MRLRFAAGLACAALLALGAPGAVAADPGPGTGPSGADPGSGVVAQAVRAADLVPGVVPPGATPKPTRTSTPTRPPATPAPTHRATPAPTRDPALAAAIARWVADGGEDDLATLGADFTVLEQAASSGRLPAMSAGCRRLGIDVLAVRSHAPIPDARAEHYWAAAMDAYVRGAADCVAGTRADDTGLMMKASDEIIEGSDDIDRVTDRLNEIG